MWEKGEEIDFNGEWIADWNRRDAEIRFEDHQQELKGSGEASMQFKETGTAIEFEPTPAAMHVSRCIRVIDLGTAHDSMYDKDKHSVFIMFEIPNEMKTYQSKDGKEITEPFTIGKFYNMSLTEGSHLRTDLESWRGVAFTPEQLAGFDPKTILGKPCMINVIHAPNKKRPGKITAAIKAVTPMPKSITCPSVFHPLVYFSLENFDQKVFDEMSSGLKKYIETSYEYIAMKTGIPWPPVEEPAQPSDEPEPPVADDGFDDIPF